MPFEILDSLSLPGNPSKPNEDAFGHAESAAAVFDGATSLSEPLMPGPSDPAWLAQFGARRLMAHCRDGDAPRDALRHALADADKSFTALRRRAPKEHYELPIAAMMFVAQTDRGLEAFWFGDCGLLLSRPGEPAELVGEAYSKRVAETESVRKLSKEKGVPPAGKANRPEFLAGLRAQRNKVNTGRRWAFSPDIRAADHVEATVLVAPQGSLLLLASDGFLVLGGDYGRYDMSGLIAAAQAKGLAALGGEIRAIENDDPDGLKYPRFKTSDDCTALLLRIV